MSSRQEQLRESVAALHHLVDGLQDVSAALHADALHSRMTGATVALLDDAPTELAKMLHLAAAVISALLPLAEGGAE